MAKRTMTVKVGQAYNINALNKLAVARGLKPLSKAEFAGMSASQVKAYVRHLKQIQSINRKDAKIASRTFRKNAKLMASENLKQAELTHGTIRQGIAELGIMGGQGIAQAGLGAFTRPTSNSDSVDQNITGGTTDVGSSTEQGPVYAYGGREED